MTPGDSAASEASDLSGLRALVAETRNVCEVHLALWKLTGFDIAQRPPRKIWRDALWSQALLDSLEGRPLRIPTDSAIWFYLDTPDEGCEVEAFA